MTRIAEDRWRYDVATLTRYLNLVQAHKRPGEEPYALGWAARLEVMLADVQAPTTTMRQADVDWQDAAHKFRSDAACATDLETATRLFGQAHATQTAANCLRCHGYLENDEDVADKFAPWPLPPFGPPVTAESLGDAAGRLPDLASALAFAEQARSLLTPGRLAELVSCPS